MASEESSSGRVESRGLVQANVLDRNVAITSSYDHVRQVLCDETKASGLSSGNAYASLMASFFPPRKFLLEDAPFHRAMKDSWTLRAKLPKTIDLLAQKLARSYFENTHLVLQSIFTNQ